MKSNLRLSLVFFILFSIASLQKTFAQCLQIESILVDACDTGSDEGFNEMVRFKVGSSNLNTTNLTVDWPSNNWENLIQNSATASKVVALNNLIAAAGGCGRLIEPTGKILPANSKVILVTSNNFSITSNVFGAITENIYIIFQNNPDVTSGHFANYNTVAGLRTLKISFGSSCSDSVTYDRTKLININGGKGGGAELNDGATVNFTPSGTASYVNNGCSAPVEVFSVNAGNSPITACSGETISLSGSAQGQQSVVWSVTPIGGSFSSSNTLSTNYTISPSASGAITLTLTATNTCNVTKTSTVTLNVNLNQTPVFNQTAPICSGATLNALPITSNNSISGTWSPVLNNALTTVYTFTPTLGQCAKSVTKEIVVENCGFGSFASAAWVENCFAPSGQFYNSTGTGTNLINPGSPEGSFMTDFGTFERNSAKLTFGGGEIKTFKTSGGNVCGATMYYNVHSKNDVAGVFTPIDLKFFSNCNGGIFEVGAGPCATGDQKWQSVTSDLVDLTALPTGDYVLEVYYVVKGDNNSNSQCNDTIVLNNSGANYLSSFSIQSAVFTGTNPTTCRGTDGAITISGLSANTAYNFSYKKGALNVGPNLITSNSIGNIIISGLTSGSYSNFSLSFNNCSSVNNSSIVLVDPVLNFTVSKVENTVCSSATVPCNGTASVNATGSGFYSYLWNDGLAQTTATASGLCPGSYSVTVTDLVSTCTDTKSITILDNKIEPVFVNLIASPSSICSGGNAVINLNGSANAIVTYTINLGSTQTTTLNASGNGVIAINGATSNVTVLLSQITLGTCSVALTNSITVNVSAPTNPGILSGIQEVCNGVNSQFSSTQAGGNWASSNPSVATIDTNGVITGVSDGNSIITYTMIGTGGCLDTSITRSVTVSSISVIISASCFDSDYKLTANASNGNSAYEWYKGTTKLSETSNTLIVKSADIYKVVANSNGCIAEVSENVTSFYCDIPKGISPNGDGKNDYFDLTNFNVRKLEIFNRYGMKVYTKSNYKKEWSGTSDSGQELPDATYYYVVEFESGTTKTGWVYINR